METKVKFISSSNYPVYKGSQIKEHSHIYYQLYYIMEGNPVFVVDGTEIHAHPGTFFYLPPNVPHKMLPLQDEVMCFYEFKAQITHPFYIANLKKISPVVEDTGYVKNMLSHIFDNWRYKTEQNIENAETILKTVFLSFFLQDIHYEYEHDKVARIQSEDYNAITQKVISYIGVNYNSEFSLKALSEKLNYNGSYISAVFTKNTGISVVDFLNLYRIRIAISLLVFYSSDVMAACSFVGYSNLSHFSRTFKKYTGSTPRDFKYVFSNVDRALVQHLFTDEPVLNGGICTIQEALESLKSLGAAVNKVARQQRENSNEKYEKPRDEEK